VAPSRPPAHPDRRGVPELTNPCRQDDQPQAVRAEGKKRIKAGLVPAKRVRIGSPVRRPRSALFDPRRPEEDKTVEMRGRPGN